MKAISNKYKGRCEVCQKWVKPNTGYICRDAHGFIKQKANPQYTAVWCKTHVPVKKGSPLGDRRMLVKGGVGCCVTPYEPDNLNLFRSMPGARFRKAADPENVLGVPYWQVSIAAGDRLRLLEIADRLELAVDDELREIEVSEQAQTACVTGLYPFQVVGVDWLAKGDVRLLADDMGLGKTVETLVAFPKKAAALCVVPASLKYNWEAECIKWRPDLEPVVLNGRGSFRFPKAGEVVIVNYDILPPELEPKKKHPNAKPWDVVVRVPLSVRETCKDIIVVFDEAHKLKNPKTGRAKRCKGLGILCGRVWALTGTPLENRPMDLWGMLSCLGMSRTVFGSYNRFLEVMDATPNIVHDRHYGYNFGTPNPIVPELLRRVMLRRKRDDVLPDLPKKQHHTIKVELPKHLQTKMDAMWNEWGDLIDKERELPPFEEFSELRAALAESRIPAMIELVEDHEEQDVPLVVFSAHLAPVLACGEREGWEIITGATPSKKRHEIVSQFQAGNLKGLALTMRAGGVGLTLTHAWKAIFVDQDWVPSLNHQAEDRLCRIGQLANCVEIVRLVSDHVLDVHVLVLIAWKVGLIEATVEKLIQVKPQVKGESNEEFAARMADAAASTDGLALETESEALSDDWPEIKNDPDIPF